MFRPKRIKLLTAILCDLNIIAQYKHIRKYKQTQNLNNKTQKT